MSDTLQLKRGRLDKWEEINPVLAAGETVVVYDPSTFMPIGLKSGNGLLDFKSLPLFGVGGGGGNTDSYSRGEVDRLLSEQKDQIEAAVVKLETLGADKSVVKGILSDPSTGQLNLVLQNLETGEGSSINLTALLKEAGFVVGGSGEAELDEIRQKADDAISTANSAALTASNAMAAANTAASSAASADNKALEALTAANSANDSASNAESKATEAFNKAGNLEKLIPEEASESNKLTSENRVAEMIQTMSGRYLSADQNGNAFATDTALKNAQVFYYGTTAILKANLLVNDQAQVASDTTEGRVGKVTLYFWSGAEQGWIFRNVVNETTFTEAQLAAMNSGVTASKLSAIETGVATNKAAIENEVARAGDSEQQLSTRLEGEAARAKAREDELNTSVTSAQSAADSAGVTANAAKASVDQVKTYLPTGVSDTNKLASISQVSDMIRQNAGRKLSASPTGSPFANVAALKTGPYYYAGAVVLPTDLLATDTATVLADENNSNASAVYGWDGTNWVLSSLGNASFSEAQMAAINSGITEAKLQSMDSQINETSSGLASEITNRQNAVKAVQDEANSKIAAHNSSTEAHADIRSSITAAQNSANNAATQAAAANTLAAEAKALAEGRQKAFVFETLLEMTSSLKTADNKTYKLGDDLYIKDKGVPDYWVSKVLETNTGTYGYYEISEHESKTDLSGYQTKEDSSLATNAKTVVGAIGEVKETADLAKEKADTLEASLTGVSSKADEAKTAAENAQNTINDYSTAHANDYSNSQIDSKVADAKKAGTDAAQAAATAQSTADSKYAKPASGIPESDLSSSVQNSLAAANAAVKSVTEGVSNGTISVNGSDVKVKGLGTAAYKNEGDFATPSSVQEVKNKADANATSITNLQSTVAGVQSEVSNKASTDQLAGVSTRTANLETNVSALQGSVSALQGAVTGKLSREIVDSLPSVESAEENVIYMVKKTDLLEGDEYDEYLLVNVSGIKKLEPIGSSKASFNGLATEDYVNQKITDAAHSIFTAQKTDLNASDDSVISGFFQINTDKLPGLNDIFLIETIIDNQVYERSSYIYDGTQWVAIAGNVDASKVILHKDFVLAGSYSNVGNIKKTSDGTTFSAKGLSVEAFFEKMLKASVAPSVTKPSLSVSMTGHAAGSYEVGETVNIGYALSFEDGHYQHGPNPTGSTVTSRSVTCNGTTKVTDTGTFTHVMSENESFYLSASVEYTAGYNPLDYAGEEAPNSRIQAGTATAQAGPFTAYLARFIGVNPSWFNGNVSALTSANIRTLTKKTSTPTSISGNDPRYMVIAVPGNWTSCKVVHSVTNIPFGTAEKASVQVADAGGTLRTYTVFYIANATAASGSNTYTISIS